VTAQAQAAAVLGATQTGVVDKFEPPSEVSNFKPHSPRRNRLRHWLMFDVLDQFPPPLTQGPHQPPNL
jgi:hypothetical protein